MGSDLRCPVVSEGASPIEWQQVTALLRKVYVIGSFTTKEAASNMMTPENLEPAGTLLVAKETCAGAVLGTTLFLHPDSALKQLAQDGEREFRLLAVATEARGKGVGELLVQACIDRAKNEGATGLVLWTQPTMYAAQRLYERLGFQRCSARDVPDPRGWDRMVFRRCLR